MNIIHYKKRMIACLLILLLLFSGCRQSPNLQQIIYDRNSNQKDSNAQEINDDQKNKDRQNNITPKSQDKDSDDTRERTRDNPVAGEDNADKDTSKIKHDSSSDSNEKSKDKNKKKNNSEESTNNPTSDTNGVDDTDSTANITYKQVVDGNGKLTNVPENVDRVAAVGEVAVIVQMLGGANRLVASSASFTSNALTRTVFADESVTNTAALWSSAGTTALSSDGFAQLLAKKPQVCFETSGDATFTEAQVKTLASKKISYVVLPKLNTSANVKLAINIIAQVLGDKSGTGGLNAPKIAAEYESYYNSVISDISGKVKRFTNISADGSPVDYDNDRTMNTVKYISGYDTSTVGKYSLFIPEWNSQVYWQISNGTTIPYSGYGAAITLSGYSYSPLCYYMSLAGVVNSSAIEAGVSQKTWYVNPMQNASFQVSFSGASAIQPADNKGLTYVGGVGDPTASLGESNFSAIIVTSSAAKQLIESNTLWKSYGVVGNSNGTRSEYGLPGDESNFVLSTIRGNYDIYINPSGVGSWYNGSAEGILEPYWIACKFYGAYTESEVKQKIKDFYSKFYRCNLSDAQVNTIYSGI